MINNITMIPITQLLHHPRNPRIDLGDLTELAESIKTQGILQNLTVVPNPESDGYLVLIGNRRMEAAKQAGVTELPCAIVEMDETDQIATMLTENMHRNDLTMYEQAQGVQMMMDLGLTEGQISEMTGFSRTTVKRRAEMARLDKDTLKAKCAQLTISDVDKLMKIRDIEKRNELLKEAGSNNFSWKIENAIAEQKREDAYKQIRAILLQAGCIEKDTNGMHEFWMKYEYLPYPTRISLDTYEAGQSVLPEDDRQLYFYKEWSYIRFWAEKPKPEEQEDEEPTAEEIEKQKRLDEAQTAWTKLEEIEKHAQESRDSFIADLTVKQKDNRKALEWMIQALTVTNNAETCLDRVLPDPSDEELEQLPDGHTEADIDLDYIRTGIAEAPTLYAEVMGSLFFDEEDSIWSRWNRSNKPKYCRNLAMITGYEWLEDFGYKTSDEERKYLDGTLDCYQETEETV